jgi:hypothetical protein
MTPALLIPLAHAAHWYFLPLYAAPVLLVLYSALRTARQERRERGETSRPRKKETR